MSYEEFEITTGIDGQYLKKLEVPFEVADTYYRSVTDHIANVVKCGRKLGVPEEQLQIHDKSKFSNEEFPHYAMYFHSGIDKSPLDAAEQSGLVSNAFARAWLHHIHHNPHHWQHWIFPDGYSPKGSDVESGIVHMPPSYALEMIADWMGASIAYTGSEDMTQWLYKNMPRISLHSRTADYVRGILDMLGYADTVFMQRFRHEAE